MHDKAGGIPTTSLDRPQSPSLPATRSDAALPDDPALPALGLMRAVGPAAAIRALDLGDCDVQLHMRRYHPGKRATLEAYAGTLHCAVKAYARDPRAEAELYDALAAAGLGGDAPIRAPRLLARDAQRHMLVFSWLEGPSAKDLIENGQGERVGRLGARWLRGAARLRVTLGDALGSHDMMRRARKWAAAIDGAGAELAAAARAMVETLARTQPADRAVGLVNGGLYADHVVDLAECPGVIDWGRFAQGPIELDAGVFLASVHKFGLRSDQGGEAVRAENVLLADTEDLLDQRTVAWHEAAELVRHAGKVTRHGGDWHGQAQALLTEAARVIDLRSS